MGRDYEGYGLPSRLLGSRVGLRPYTEPKSVLLLIFGLNPCNQPLVFNSGSLNIACI